MSTKNTKPNFNLIGTGPLFFDMTLKELFEKMAKNIPNQISVEHMGHSWTYKKLDEKANQLAEKLRESGVGPEQIVGVLLPPSFELVVSLMAILKAGGAYLPLDKKLPKDRISFMVKDSGAKVILYQDSLEDKLPSESILSINVKDKLIYSSKAKNIETIAKPHNLAYIIYTSGSTGKPKGVMIEHKQCVNTLLDIKNKFKITTEDKILLVSSIGFDLSVFDIFGALVSGATIVIPNADGSKSEELLSWKDCILNKGVTIWNSAPLLMRSLIENFQEDKITKIDSQLRLVLMSGDWIPLMLPNSIRKHFGKEIEIISLGGATEGAIWSIYYPIRKVSSKWRSIPYGKPLLNQSIEVLDKRLNPCPIGVAGEIYIGGKGVARGYVNREKLTRERFINREPLTNKLYKTGDLGQYLPDGNVEILGRLDNQVKIKGVRIEIGEIEYHLNSFDSITQGVVMDLKGENGDKFLVGYYVSKKNQRVDSEEIKKHLAKSIANEMVPSFFVPIKQLPLTHNGKLNRQELENIFNSYVSDEYSAPNTKIEKLISQIWQKILNLESISTQDDFFAIGGNSLQAMRVCQKISQTLGVSLKEITFFENPTIRKLSNFLEIERSH